MSFFQKKREGKKYSKKYILSCFILFILLIHFAKILPYQNCQANKNQTRHEITSLVMVFDTLCIDSHFLEFLQIPPLGNEGLKIFFSRQEGEFAKPIFNIKRLVNTSKSYFYFSLSLLKYRFFDAKKSLEELQAKKNEGLKVMYSPDNLRFIRGLVLGEKSSSASYMPAFENAGMLHVLVASGFNIALVAGTVGIIIKKFPLVQRFFTTLFVIWGYAAYLDFDPPLLRAAWMFSLVLLLQHTGIQTRRSRVLMVSMGGILLIQPELISSLSLWLSSLATLGILTFARRLSLFWQEGGVKKSISSIFLEESATSFSAQALIFPLLVWFFHSVNLVSFLANPVMLPWLGTLTQLSALGVILSFLDNFWLVPLVSALLAIVLNKVFALYFAVVAWWQTLFFLNFSPTSGETQAVFAVWALIIVGIYFAVRKKPEEKGLFFHEKV